MKKLLACVLSLIACGCLLASCSNNRQVNSEGTATVTTTHTSAASKAESSSAESSSTASSSEASNARNTNSTAGRTTDRNGNIVDDVRQGIDNGLNTAEDIVDDILP